MDHPSPPLLPPLAATLPDHSLVEFRLSQPQDKAAIIAMAASLSDKTLYFRFFTVRHPTPSEIEKLTHGSTPAGTVLLALRQHQIIGLSRYVNTSPAIADVALTVSDQFQAQGIGALSLQLLAAFGYAAGLTTLTADILAANTPIRALFTHAHLQAAFGPISAGAAQLRMHLEDCAPLWQALNSPSLTTAPPRPIPSLLQFLRSLRQEP